VPGPGSPDVGPVGRSPYWHTPEDTLDKLDVDALALDTRYRVAQIYELATLPILPHRIGPIAASFVQALDELAAAAGNVFDLTPVRAAASRMAQAAARLDRELPAGAASIEERNSLVVRVTHRLNAALYTRAGRFGQDPAAPLPVLPLLADVRELAGLPRTSSAFGFLETDLFRRRNAVMLALMEAADDIEAYLDP
jgi:hypothetical protein